MFEFLEESPVPANKKSREGDVLEYARVQCHGSSQLSSKLLLRFIDDFASIVNLIEALGNRAMSSKGLRSMDENTKKLLREFFKICWARLETGERISGNHFIEMNLFDEITQELADIANYAFLEYVKVTKLKAKASRLSASQDQIKNLHDSSLGQSI